MKKLLLIGGGGHCRSCIDVIRLTGQYDIIGIIDLPEKIDQEVDGVKIIGTDSDIENWLQKTDECLITLGHLGRSERRQQIYQQLKSSGATFATVVSSRAYCADTATIGAGTIVMHDALVNVGAYIGDNCIINSKALIEHDANIGSHTHIATRATVNGTVNIGENCFIGSQAMIFNNCNIGSQSVVGGGQVVSQNLPENTKPSDISGASGS